MANNPSWENIPYATNIVPRLNSVLDALKEAGYEPPMPHTRPATLHYCIEDTLDRWLFIAPHEEKYRVWEERVYLSGHGEKDRRIILDEVFFTDTDSLILHLKQYELFALPKSRWSIIK